MIVVADASPLIFLAKIRRLELLHALFGQDIQVPAAVQREVLETGVDPVEADLLKAFLQTCTIVTVQRPRRFASAMSQADNEAVTLAARTHAAFLLCDDRITRLMAEAEGIRPLGTLGILLRAMRQKRMTPTETRAAVDLLVGTHHFRISIELYQAVLTHIGRAAC